MLEKLNGHGLILHHWDTDGICSAAILMEELKVEVDTIIPFIGNYFLTEEEIHEISSKNYDFIIVADMALPSNDILSLKRKSKAEIFIFDHHIQQIINEVNHHNPVSEGKPAENYPSNTWVLTEYFNREVDLLSVLGAIGDNEKKIQSNSVIYLQIGNYMEKSGLDFEGLLRMAELIDSNYKVGNPEKVLNAAFFVKENASIPSLILDNPEWKKNILELEDEFQKQSEKPLEIEDGVAFQEIKTKYNIISPLTRKLAWNGNFKAAVVVNRGYFEESDQIYVRTQLENLDLMPIIDSANKRGYSAGGKKVVAGIILPKKDTDEYLNVLKVLLKKPIVIIKGIANE